MMKEQNVAWFVNGEDEQGQCYVTFLILGDLRFGYEQGHEHEEGLDHRLEVALQAAEVPHGYRALVFGTEYMTGENNEAEYW